MPQPVNIMSGPLAGIELLPFGGQLGSPGDTFTPPSGEVWVFESIIIAHKGSTNIPTYAHVFLDDGSGWYLCFNRPVPQGQNWNVLLGRSLYLPYPWTLTVSVGDISPADTGHYSGSYAILT